MSGDTTYQALKRLSWLPERDASQNGSVIAGQDYNDVEFIGGSASNLILTDVTINGSVTSRTETIVTVAGTYIVQPSDYVITINKTVPEITSVTLPASPAASRSLIVKDGAGNAASYNITLDGNGKNIDGQATQILNVDYEALEIIYNGTEWNIIAQVDSFAGVEGPGLSTDKAIVRFNGTTGQIVQNSTVTIGNTGIITGASIDTAAAANIVKVNGTSLTAVTGTGSVVLANTPTLITPVLGAAIGTSLNLSGLTASSAVATDGSKNLVSVTNTGSGNNVLATAPTVTNISSDKYTSTVATGTAPLVVASTTLVPNLYVARAVLADSATINANLTGAVTSVGNATSLGSFTSANLATALTDETGSGAAVFATSPVLVTPALGTPSSGVATNLTGTATALNIGGNAATATTASTVTTNANLTGAVTSVGNATSLGSFTSVQLATALTDETGSGANVFATSPVLVTPVLGTPSSGVLTNCTGTASGLTAGNVTTNANLTGPITSSGNATSITAQTGTGTKFVVDTSPTLVTPNIGAATGTSLNLSGLTASANIETDGSKNLVSVTNTGTGNNVKATSPTITGVVLDSTSTVPTAATTTNGTGLSSTAFSQNTAVSWGSGFINKFRNASMTIAQRGTSGTITAGSPAYTLDGWIVSSTGANAAWVQTSVAHNGAYYGLQIQGNTSQTDLLVKQRIEAVDCEPLAGNTVTVQCTIQNGTGATLTPTLTVKEATAIDNWGATTTVVNAVNLQSIANGATGTVAYAYLETSSAQNGVETTFDFGTQNSSAKNIYVTAFDIRSTPNATTGLISNPPVPELRPISIEMTMNQRYFYSTFGNGITPAQNAGKTNCLTIKNPIALGDPSLYVEYPVQMRIKPGTVTTYNPSAGNANWRDITAAADVTVSVDSPATAGPSGIILATSGTVTTLGDYLGIHLTASAEL